LAAPASYVDLFENLRIELRSGCLALAVLAHLRVEHYGYTLCKALSRIGLELEENTVYPLLRRLEAQGLLVSEWRDESGRRKRFYRLTRTGQRMLDDLADEWDRINGALEHVVGRTAAR
jgi:PadR family transcriptional regulator PadR